jgi:AbrB family looped-hinge helix DNA binding protein
MSSVTQKGQVTIPKEIREKAGIEPGDDLEFEIGKDGTIKVKKNVEENPFSRWEGELDLKKSTDEIMEELRGE